MVSFTINMDDTVSEGGSSVNESVEEDDYLHRTGGHEVDSHMNGNPLSPISLTSTRVSNLNELTPIYEEQGGDLLPCVELQVLVHRWRRAAPTGGNRVATIPV